MCPITAITTPLDELYRRRSSVLESLGEGVMVLPSAPIQYASRDNQRSYVSDRELFYLTGLVEPGCVAVLVGGPTPRVEIFTRSRDEKAELWTGPRLGPDGAQVLSGADEAHCIEELRVRLPALLEGADRIYARLREGGLESDLVIAALAAARANGARHGSGPRGVMDPGEILDDLRLKKSGHELEIIRKACQITVTGHRAAANAIADAEGEWTIEAELERAFRASGASGPGFDSIVGGGQNACVLHYVENNASLSAGELVLIDAGAEYGLYHGDVTRTYPVNGRFSDEQRALYQIVEEARLTAIASIKPGATITDVHDAASRVLAQGLLDLGVLHGDKDSVLDEGSYRDFFPHQTSHWLGLDVHDPGDYGRDGSGRILEPGMVFTIEPGLYFRLGQCGNNTDRWAGIGVRIEDDVVVTAEGVEVLTGVLPTSVDEVEEAVGI